MSKYYFFPGKGGGGVVLQNGMNTGGRLPLTNLGAFGERRLAEKWGSPGEHDFPSLSPSSPPIYGVLMRNMDDFL